MTPVIKQHIAAMINAAESQKPKDFSNHFTQALRHKLADRLNDARKVVAAQVFSPPISQE